MECFGFRVYFVSGFGFWVSGFFCLGFLLFGVYVVSGFDCFGFRLIRVYVVLGLLFRVCCFGFNCLECSETRNLFKPETYLYLIPFISEFLRCCIKLFIFLLSLSVRSKRSSNWF